MTQKDKEILLAKLQELVTIAKGIPCEEATLFDQHLQEAAENATLSMERPAIQRQRFKDGSMTASQIARRVSKMSGEPVSRETVIRVAKDCHAKAIYNERQHNSRYTAESV